MGFILFLVINFFGVFFRNFFFQSFDDWIPIKSDSVGARCLRYGKMKRMVYGCTLLLDLKNILWRKSRLGSFPTPWSCSSSEKWSYFLFISAALVGRAKWICIDPNVFRFNKILPSLRSQIFPILIFSFSWIGPPYSSWWLHAQYVSTIT